MHRLLPSCALALLLAVPVQAQLFSYGGDDDGPSQSVSVGYHWVDFTFSGDGDGPAPNFTFIEPVLGAVYTRPNLYVSLAVGNQDVAPGGPRGPRDPQENLRLLDMAFSTFGGLPIPGLSATSNTSLVIPIVLHSSYRRVRLDQERDDVVTQDFNFTVLGIGTGLALRSELAPSVRFEARATPIIGLALRSFGDTTGRATRLEADAQLHLGRLVQGVGLTLGYRYGLTSWNTSASDLFPNISNQFFDYNGSHHIVHLGVNW